MRTVFYPPAQAYLSYHYISGSKPTHVYLAGIGIASTGCYPSLIYGSELAGYHSLMPDFLGYGYSDRPEAFGYTVDEHADTIAFLLDQLQVSGCTLIGNSFGGAVAITLATKRPDLVGRLILAEAVLDAGDWFGVGSQSEEQFITTGHGVLLEEFRQDLPDYTESSRSWWPMVELASPLAFYRTAYCLFQGVSPTWREQLYRLKIPRLFLLGEISLQKEALQVENKHDLPPNGIQVAIIPKTGHMMMWENPAGFVQAIAAFEAH